MKRKAFTIIKRLLSAVLFLALVLTIASHMSKRYNITSDVVGDAAPYSLFQAQEGIECAFIGSSHVFCAIIPQMLFDEYGIASTLLATPGQPLTTSEEMLELAISKGVKTVVFDVMMLTRDHYANMDELPTGEQMNRKSRVAAAARMMPETSPRKYWVMSQLWNQVDPYQQKFSAIIDRHGDYLNLDRSNFEILECFSRSHGYRYYNITLDELPALEEPTEAELSALALSSRNKATIRRMKERCEQSGVELLFIKIPEYANGTIQRLYALVGNAAAALDIPYLDWQTIMDGSGMDFATDLYETGHLNYYGASKVTRYVGKYLAERYSFTDARVDGGEEYADFRSSKESYISQDAAEGLADVTDIPDYLARLALLDDSYLALMATEGDVSGMPDATRQALRELGLLPDGAQRALTAAAAGSEIFGDVNASSMLCNIDGRKIDFVCGKSSSIFVDGVLLSVKQPGIKLVVLDRLSGKVIDSISFGADSGAVILRKN